MEPIHKINNIKRRLTKVCTVPEKKSLNESILDTLKRRPLSLKDSFVSLLPKRPEDHMWDQKCAFLLGFPAKSTLPSQEMISHRTRNNPKNPQTAKSQLPKSSSKMTVQQKMIRRLQVLFTHRASVDQNNSPLLQIITSQNTTMRSLPHEDQQSK
uniref:Uncharacterized protein n=1 Tax=Opuntia streptacantha TaxID=393608 RepID=A0A7C9CRI5_OPUST